MTHELMARDLMTHPVRKLTSDTRVADAAAFLLRWGISGAPVLDEHNRPVGVFSMTDLARHAQEWLVTPSAVERTLETRGKIPSGRGYPFESFEEARVSDLMTPGLVTVLPDATLDEVARSMVSRKIHRIFVISEKMELEGVITSMDVIQWIDRELLARKATIKP